MDLLSFLLGVMVSLWGVLQIIYPKESTWFHKKWLDYLEKRTRRIALTFILVGLILLLIVWYTNSLIVLVIGSFLLYTGFKYLIFGKKVLELSRSSLKSSKSRWRIMGVWLLFGGLGLIYLSTWF
jgi:hypothetical protein